MKFFVAVLMATVLLSACQPGAGVSRSGGGSGDWTGLQLVRQSATTQETAATAYFDCLALQIGLQRFMNDRGFSQSTGEQRVDAAIESCRPTARNYATRIMEEETNFDRRFYSENIRNIVLPDIEMSARQRLLTIEG